MTNEDTLLPRFFGLYRIRPKGGNNVRFVVMNNVFNTSLQIHERYDLKGSVVGRMASEEEKQKKNPILKDMDIDKHIFLGNFKTELFYNQIESDCSVCIVVEF